MLKDDLVKAVWGSDAGDAGHSVNEYISTLRRIFRHHQVDFNGLVANEPKVGWRIAPAKPAAPAAADESDPVILILEDERAQILALAGAARRAWQLVEFIDPERRSTYARRHACDAAIVDVRMPPTPPWTGSRSCARCASSTATWRSSSARPASPTEIADEAIELRAIKRAVKSKTTLAELRRSTQEAIPETRERREMRRNAQAAEATKAKLAEALGTYDLRLAAADLHRGLIYGLRNQLTALVRPRLVLQADAAERRSRLRGARPLPRELAARMINRSTPSSTARSATRGANAGPPSTCAWGRWAGFSGGPSGGRPKASGWCCGT